MFFQFEYSELLASQQMQQSVDLVNDLMRNTESSHLSHLTVSNTANLELRKLQRADVAGLTMTMPRKTI